MRCDLTRDIRYRYSNWNRNGRKYAINYSLKIIIVKWKFTSSRYDYNNIILWSIREESIERKWLIYFQNELNEEIMYKFVNIRIKC